MTRLNETCGTEFVADDGSPNLVCVRSGRHYVHETADGKRFFWAPGGAWVKLPDA